MKRYSYIIILLLIIVALILTIVIKFKKGNDDIVIDVQNETKFYNPIIGKVSFDSSFNDIETTNLEIFLKDFFERYYLIIEKMEYNDISDMFSNKENAYIYKTALELLIENRKNSLVDLKANDVKYELKVNNYKKTDESIKFTILETCSYRFDGTKEYETKVYDVENKFELIEENNEYKIKNFDKVQDFYVMITDVYKTKENYEEALDKIKSDYLVKFEEQKNNYEKMRKEYLNNNYKTLECDHGFDRESAYKYAISWVGKRNSEWHTYNANCVNYVSQVMYAGGIPMDHLGSEQWKWYSTKRNTKNVAEGFVYSWTYVPAIVSYFQNNEGYGLCGKYDENVYLGDVGDVIVVGTTGPNRHVVSVVGQIKNEKGEVVDLLVNSNTVDLEYFPLSAYAYPYRVLMKVYGWND